MKKIKSKNKPGGALFLTITLGLPGLISSCDPAPEPTEEASVQQSALALGTRLRLQDWDGDGRSDLVVFAPVTGIWFVKPSGGGPEISRQFGVTTDSLVPGDYDGDGKTDFAVYRSGQVFATRSAGGPDIVLYTSGFPAFAADFDGDGKTDAAHVNTNNSQLQWVASDVDSAETLPGFPVWGDRGDIPVPQDYDGDGKTDLAVFKPSTGVWKILRSSGTWFQTQFGESTDRLVPADYTGDRKADLALFRPRDNRWYVHRTDGLGRPDMVIDMGVASDRLVPSDYDGDGIADFAVVRGPGVNTWFARRSRADGPDMVNQFHFWSDRIPNAK